LCISLANGSACAKVSGGENRLNGEEHAERNSDAHDVDEADDDDGNDNDDDDDDDEKRTVDDACLRCNA
jgi:hypothetical protein